MGEQSDLGRYVATIRKWWWLLMACVLVASGSSYVGTLQMPRIYQATTTVVVGQGLKNANPDYQDLFMAERLAQTYGEMAKRRPVLSGAAEALGLQYVPSSGSISTEPVKGTQLLEIRVRDSDAQRARALADEIARQLILQSPTGGGEEEQRRAFVEQQLQELEGRIQAVGDEIDSEREKLASANSARAIQQYQANIAALEQKTISYQSTYASLLIHFQGSANYLTIIESATTPTVPISPNVQQTVVLAAAIGLALAVAGAFLIEYLDDTIRTGDEVAAVTELPLVGEIARIKSGEDGYASALITLQDPISPVSEAYRVLRTNVRFASVDRPPRTLMVTSSGPSEGKSVTVANLGIVLAQAGTRTVIVDTDLRRPVQHKIFGLPNHRGLSDALLEPHRDIMEYVQGTEVENLRFLASGQTPPNPSELLGSARFGEIVDALLCEADLLLFDSSPTLMVTDATILGSRVDGVVFVTDVGKTRRVLAAKGVDKLRQANANLLGVVLNRVPQTRGGYYYMYSYYSSDDTRNGRHGSSRRHRGGGLMSRLTGGGRKTERTEQRSQESVRE